MTASTNQKSLEGNLLPFKAFKNYLFVKYSVAESQYFIMLVTIAPSFASDDFDFA